MKLTPLGSNRTQVEYNNGTLIFFSYKTPVAGYSRDLGFVRTEDYYSVTTSRHINQWLENVEAQKVSQETINNLVGN